LSIFYFPILPYITRFVTIPLIFLIFFDFITSKTISYKKYILIVLAFLFTSTSYTTATVFIALFMGVMIFCLIQPRKFLKRSLLITALFISCNLFWLVSFLNYTVQKADIVKLAPIFTNANESQLNKPKSFYSLQNQLILEPNFFESSVNKLSSKERVPLYVNLRSISGNASQALLFIFPTLYILGSILILLYHRRSLWIPLTIGFFLFLSLKEYSIFGFIFVFLEKNIPFFDIIFRFGDTKFHPHVAFAGSLAVGFAILGLIGFLSKINKKGIWLASKIMFFLLLLSTIFVFRSYLTGSFIGSFMYNKIPGAYFKAADIINNDPQDFRVLHIPYDKEMYWRSYNWGYLGSAFFQYLIDKPLFDKTFEPASQENADVMRLVYENLNINSFESPEFVADRSDHFYEILKKLGIKYIVLDESVSPEQSSKDILAWGKYNYNGAHIVIDDLIAKGEIQVLQSFPIVGASGLSRLFLYEVKNPYKKISSINNFESTHNSSFDSFEKFVSEGTQNYFDDNSYTNQSIYPFLKNKSDWINNPNSISVPVNIKNGSSSLRYITYDKKNSTSYQIELYGKKTDKGIIMSLYNKELPLKGGSGNRYVGEFLIPSEIIERAQGYGGNTIDNYLSNWYVLPNKKIAPLRLRLEESILPIPSDFSEQNKYIGSALVHASLFQVSLLAPLKYSSIPTSELSLTEKINCLGNISPDYQYVFENKEINNLRISSKSGSVCFWRSLKDIQEQGASHWEIGLSIKREKNNEIENKKASLSKGTSKPILKNVLSSLPNFINLNVCIKDSQRDDCLNNHQNLAVSNQEGQVIIPIDRPSNNAYDLVALFALENYQGSSEKVVISDFMTYQFNVVKVEEFHINEAFINNQVAIKLNQTANLNLTFTKSISPNSYFHNPGKDGFGLSNDLCGENDKRLYKLFKSELLIYGENCLDVASQLIPYTSKSNFLWSVNYNLLSGQYPRMKMSDEFHTYYDEYASLENGYPDIKEFRTFQNPEISTPMVSKKGITATLDKVLNKQSIVKISEKPFLNDNKKKQYDFQQFSENEGIMAINSFDIIEMPSYIDGLKVSEFQNNSRDLKNIPIRNFYSIFPSLWRINFDFAPRSLEEDGMIYFNEAYDSQWGIYESIFDVVINKKADVVHGKCNSYANCFLFQKGYELPDHLFIFYSPERLLWIGWGMMLSFVVLLKRLFTKQIKLGK
ncbi:MAG: hypothetical protein ACMG6E_01265, partial [Candidatus Roizmanbacteria bacterium]